MAARHLIGLALQQLVPGAMSVVRFSTPAGAVAINAAAAVADPAVSFLRSRFTDQSSRLTRAVERATDRAWRALELVLAGDSLWDRLKGGLAAGDVKAFRHDVRGLLAAAGIDGAYPVDRAAAARELRAARSAGLLKPVGLTPAGMADSVGMFARFSTPAELAAAQWEAAEAVAADLTSEGYPALAAVAAFRPAGAGLPLLGVAVRYFFRRAMEEDEELARGLAFARLEALAEAQDQRFDALNRLLVEQGDRVEAALGELAAEVARVRAVVLDVRAEQARLGDQNRQIMEAILGLQAKLEQTGRAVVRPQDSLSVRTDAERELVREVIARYRKLPAEVREARPAMRNAVGMLEVAAGDFAAARDDFAAVAEAVTDPAAKGAAHLNAYRAALEARDWAAALRELIAAGRCDPRRFAPFPLGKYVPQRILGAGGFGVAFLCKHKYMDAPVVVKSLSGGGSGPDFEAVFAEARAASGIHHPRIIRVTDCGFAEPAGKDRPFIVMDYFPGHALDEYVRQHGPLAPEHLVPLARGLAEALDAAHRNSILHRDVKPGNVLVRWTGGEFDVRVIDFGLAVRHRTAADGASTSRSARTLAGESIAGTLEYAAPEQMGRVAGVRAGPYSDVYGWAKTCCFALFGTPQPTLRHWQGLPPGLADLLGRCLEDDPKRRPQSFAAIVAGLDALDVEEVPVVEGRLVVRAQADRPAQEEDDPPVRERRAGDDRPRRRRARRKPEGVPAWASVGIPLGVILVAVVVVAVVLANQKRPADPDQAIATAPENPPGKVDPPGGKQPAPGAGKVSPGAGKGGTPGTGKVGTPRNRPGTNDKVIAMGKEPYILGTIDDPKFMTVGPGGAILVGLDARFEKFGTTDIVRGVRPIYLVNGREVFGEQFGNDLSGAVTLKARAGYAVGGIVGKAGWWCNGFSLTFMRVKPDGTLDPKDSYESEWAGDDGTLDVFRVASDGPPVVGIVGKIVGSKTTALGLLFRGQEGFDPRPKNR